jgi:hypothetical protein
MAKEVIEYGGKYWLVMRSFFNHLMFSISRMPHLLKGLEHFVCGFGTTRECRSLDAEIKLYRLETMLPQAVNSKYDDVAMDEITYQGAYIRSMTLILVEGMIQNYLALAKQGDNSIKTQMIGQGLTNCILMLLE